MASKPRTPGFKGVDDDSETDSEYTPFFEDGDELE